MRPLLARLGAPLAASFALAVDRPERWMRLLAAGDTRALARRSFVAIAIALPLATLLSLVPPGGATRMALAVQLGGYLVAWLGFAAFSELVLRRSGRAAQWRPLVAVWNWCNVVQSVLLLPTALPEMLHAPQWLRLWVALVFWGWAFWLDYRALRLGLEIGAGPAGGGRGRTVPAIAPAIGLTLADVLIGMACQAAGG